jgi:hypothetical protein
LSLVSAPYVRVIQLSPQGRVVKKKKTVAQHGTREPVFNETLNFELTAQQLDTATFLVLLSHKQSSIELRVRLQRRRKDKSGSGFEI